MTAALPDLVIVTIAVFATVTAILFIERIFR